MPEHRSFRAFHRRSTSLDAKLSQLATEWGVPARVVNLGLGGAALELDQAPPDDSLLELQILSPYLWDPLELRGRIAWQQHADNSLVHLGLLFESTSGSSLLSLLELLSVDSYEA